jgi:hypothetical protein
MRRLRIDNDADAFGRRPFCVQLPRRSRAARDVDVQHFFARAEAGLADARSQMDSCERARSNSGQTSPAMTPIT